MSPDSPIIFVMVGIPGAGKSTAISKLNAKYFVSSDWHIERMAKEQGKTYNEVFSQVAQDATKEMNKDVAFMYKINANFVWDQTNLTKKKRRSILNGVPKNYRKVAVLINTALELAIERNNARDRTIPEHVIHNMYSTLEIPTLDEGFDHIIVFDGYGGLQHYEDKND